MNDPYLLAGINMLMSGVPAYIVFKIVTAGLKRSELKTTNQYGRWLSGIFISIVVYDGIKKYLMNEYTESGDFLAKTAVLIFPVIVIAYIIGFVISFFRTKLQKIPLEFWEKASKELDEGTNNGLWAEIFSNNNGNESKAKAEYLKRRSKEIYSDYQNREKIERNEINISEITKKNERIEVDHIYKNKPESRIYKAYNYFLYSMIFIIITYIIYKFYNHVMLGI